VTHNLKDRHAQVPLDRVAPNDSFALPVSQGNVKFHIKRYVK